jgi:hypothetical protein
LRVGYALHSEGGVRSLLVCLGLAGVSAIVGIRHRPEPADAAHTSRPLHIQSISLDGRSLPSLRPVLSVQAGDLYNAAKAAHDRAALERALLERGYLGAKVDGPRVTYDVTGGVFVTYAITQGPVFHVRNVTVTGATEINAGVVTLGAGEVVAADRIEHARLALAERLAVRGAPVTVVAKVYPDESAAVADVELAATPRAAVSFPCGGDARPDDAGAIHADRHRLVERTCSARAAERRRRRFGRAREEGRAAPRADAALVR